MSLLRISLADWGCWRDLKAAGPFQNRRGGWPPPFPHNDNRYYLSGECSCVRL